MKEDWSYLGGAGVGEGDSFGPAGESVDDSEEIVKKNDSFFRKIVVDAKQPNTGS